MKKWFLPKSTAGIWASGLALGFIVLIALKMSVGFFLPSMAIAALGVIGFIAGLVALIHHKDFALPVLLSILMGLLVLFWTGAELLFPH